MSKNALGALLVIASVFVVLALVGQSRNATESIAGRTAGMPLLDGLATDIDNVTRIDVVGASRQRLVRLDRNGEDWTVAELDDYPADRTGINRLLIALADARIVEEKTANPDFHSRLGVEDVDDPEAAGLELTLVAGREYAVVLGDSYSGAQSYARIADSDQSVLIDQDPDIARDQADWVDPQIVDIAADRIRSVVITHADGEEVALSKQAASDANFAVDAIPDGRDLQYAGIANVTGSVLQNLRLDEVRRRVDNAESQTTTIRFSTFDGLSVTVAALPEDDSSWLRFDAAAEEAAGEDQEAADATVEAETINQRLGNWEYRIPAYQLSQLTRRMEDLLAPLTDD